MKTCNKELHNNELVGLVDKMIAGSTALPFNSETGEKIGDIRFDSRHFCADLTGSR